MSLQDSATDEFDSNGPTGIAPGGPAGPLEQGRRISGQIIQDMEQLRNTTESSVYRIGELLNNIVNTATEDNDHVRTTLQSVMGRPVDGEPSSGHSVTGLIRDQSNSVSNFVGETRGFFEKQTTFVESASDACDKIDGCASSVSDLMKKSRLLALNMHIESVRLGDEGRAFRVIADEMNCFASEVREANETIMSALEALTQAMPLIKEQTSEMSDRVTEFSDQHTSQLAEVECKTQSLADSLQSTLDHTERCNGEILNCSNQTLSALQFQDPMSQSLQRAGADIAKLQTLLEGGTVEEDYTETTDTESGDIDLF